MYYIDNRAKYLNLTEESHHAIQYHKAGYNIIPIKDWKPLIKWSEYQNEPFPFWPNFQMFSHGFAVLSGATSGHLEVLDFDEKNNEGIPVFLQVWRQIEPELRERLCVIATPSQGFHVYYRLPQSFKSQPHLCDNSEGLPLIEQRCERLYVVGVGCLKNGKRYRQVMGDYKSPPVITLDERQSLLSKCAALNRYHRPEPIGDGRDDWDREFMRGLKYACCAESIFERFQRLATWEDVLEPLGWYIVDQRGGVLYWRRPGSINQQSAATNHNDTDKLFIYSESTNLPSRKYLSKPQVLCELACSGDWKQCHKLIERYFTESDIENAN